MHQGSKLVPYKLQAQCKAAIVKLQADNRALNVTNNSLDNFIHDNAIKSESFDALKQKVSDYKMVINALKLANDLDIADYQMLQHSVGTEVLDGNVIEIKRVSESHKHSAMENAEKMRQNARFYSEISPKMADIFEQEARDYEEEANNHQSIINHCNKKIEQYDSIEARTSTFFTSGSFVRTKALNMLSGMSSAVQGSMYVVTAIAGSRDALTSSIKVGLMQKNFKENMKTQFGFDERTSSIMWNIYSKIKTTYPESTQQERDYMFARTLSQLFYNENAESDFMKGAWAAGAGCINDYDTQGFITGLGISEEDYNYLHYTVRLQHLICSGDKETRPEKIYDKLEGQDGYTYYEKMKKGLGIEEIDKNAYKRNYNKYYMAYKDKPDFLHMMYTISAFLASNNAEGLEKDSFKVNKYTKQVIMWDSSEKRIDYTGWLGDATWPGVEEDWNFADGWNAFWGVEDDGSMYGDLGAVLNKNTSFGNDDYMADLDADNIIHRIDKNTSLMEAINDYYEETNGGETRAVEFLRNNDYNDVEDEITERAGVDSLKELKGKWLDSYNFLVRLKEEGMGVN